MMLLHQGSHTKKTGQFIRGCLAYCYITIPSIDNVFTKLDLYLLSGQCALINSSNTQCDTFYKESLNIFPEIPASYDGPDGRTHSTEQRVIDWISRYLSSLVYVPDNPAHPPLDIYRLACWIRLNYNYYYLKQNLG